MDGGKGTAWAGNKEGRGKKRGQGKTKKERR